LTQPIAIRLSADRAITSCARRLRFRRRHQLYETSRDRSRRKRTHAV